MSLLNNVLKPHFDLFIFSMIFVEKINAVLFEVTPWKAKNYMLSWQIIFYSEIYTLEYSVEQHKSLDFKNILTMLIHWVGAVHLLVNSFYPFFAQGENRKDFVKCCFVCNWSKIELYAYIFSDMITQTNPNSVLSL